VPAEKSIESVVGAVVVDLREAARGSLTEVSAQPDHSDSSSARWLGLAGAIVLVMISLEAAAAFADVPAAAFAHPPHSEFFEKIDLQHLVRSRSRPHSSHSRSLPSPHSDCG